MMAADRVQPGISLDRLLDGLAEPGSYGAMAVTGVCMDSRHVRPGELFLACRGTRTSGARHIDEAVRRGAAAVAADAGDDVLLPSLPVALIRVASLAGKAGIIAARFFADPSAALDVIGITGTNGKSTVSHLVAAALTGDRERDVGIVGTLGSGRAGELAPGVLTTPDPVALQGILAEMRDQGIRTVAMEVSSHALEQERVSGVRFAIAVFTNLSRDHLDYHGDMQAYGAAKRRLFLRPELRHAVLNLDDAFGRALKTDLSGRIPVTGYGLDEDGPSANFSASDVVGTITGEGVGALSLSVRSPWGQGTLRSTLTGRFNACNLLAAVAVAGLRDVPLPQVLARLQRAEPVPGRMECFSRAGAPTIVIDYAHSPDALAQALRALRGDCRGSLVCVFGCGGDRDRGKRADMGRVAETHADRVYVTSDNPRSEFPESIIADIRAGMGGRVPAFAVPDRAVAIRRAIAEAAPADVVLVAGKGHENYQEISGRRLPFSDRLLVLEILEELW
jgi:UDP-N-acetylmuramoyl-L-alanyl-D-glutamate--2,6-diaminopimelate ligase